MFRNIRFIGVLLRLKKASMVDFLLKNNLIPDHLIRKVIRKRLKNKLNTEAAAYSRLGSEKDELTIKSALESPIALHTQLANEQHYEVTAGFFETVLGKNLKYSCGWWEETTVDLNQSEDDMLELVLERAEIEKAQNILDLGCGWGSFSLFAAQKYPQKKFVAVSNASGQRNYIEQKAKSLNISNLKVITADINEFQPDILFDCIVSIELFEHLRNYKLLFEKLNSWLNTEGRLFVHIFSHKKFTYFFDVVNRDDWMARHFFTGGMMPSKDYIFNFSKSFHKQSHWIINGLHYSKTLEAWLQRMDSSKQKIIPVFKSIYGKDYKKFIAYWRIFFMACSETFSMNKGTEWHVNHYLFKKGTRK